MAYLSANPSRRQKGRRTPFTVQATHQSLHHLIAKTD
jgi:hypothetical protein